MNPGDVFYRNLGPGKPYKCHVVAVVDGEQVVYKWFGRKKKWWHYCVDHVSLIETFIEIHNAKDHQTSGHASSVDPVVEEKS
jgi:hypothetical protein